MEHCLKQQLLNPRLKIANKTVTYNRKLPSENLLGQLFFTSRYSPSIHSQAQTPSCTKNYFIEVYCDDFQLCEVNTGSEKLKY